MMRYLVAASGGDYPVPWNHRVSNSILQVEFRAGRLRVKKVAEPF